MLGTGPLRAANGKRKDCQCAHSVCETDMAVPSECEGAFTPRSVYGFVFCGGAYIDGGCSS
jgi:hypothetical protein